MTTRPGLRERKKQRTHDALEAAGLALFAERGYTATTVEEIAGTVDVSARTFFRYFETKDQLLFADHRRRAEALADALREPAEGSIATVTDAVIDFFIEDLPRTAGRVLLQLQIAAVHPPAQAVLYQHQADLVAVVAEELQRRRLTRRLEAQMIASAVLVAVREMGLPSLLEGDPDLGARLAEARQRLRRFGSIAAA